MLVYGDRIRSVRTPDALRDLSRQLERATLRHDDWVRLLIAAGELAQGIADARFEETGEDDLEPVVDAANALTTSIAAELLRSQRRESTDPAAARGALARLEGLSAPETVRLKQAEGYAFYALFPELYAVAARALESRPVVVIGLRSIGTSLGAMVAAATSAALFVTVRPVGHPFSRTLALSARLAASLEAHAGTATFAVVDEGPGLSGSSFGAVGDTLAAMGVPPERLVLFPAHLGALGPQASERHRTRWANAKRLVAPFEAVAGPNARHLAEAAQELVGRAERIEDLSGGAWRQRLFTEASRWPAAHVEQERRKYLVTANGRTFHVRFAGLGAPGDVRLERSRALADAGFTPEAITLRRGFLWLRWISDARPLSEAKVDRAALLEHVTRYLAFRDRSFPANRDAGATPAALLEMARHNTAEALGGDKAAPLARFEGQLERLTSNARPIATDNRLHAWEWLVTEDGRFVKADAVDHCDAHDLVGCQDVLWDLAGAEIELGLSPEESDALVARVSRASVRSFSGEARAFYRCAYLAFELGRNSLAAATFEGRLPEESERLRKAARSYALRLERALAAL